MNKKTTIKSPKKNKKKILSANVYIQAGYHNTIVTITDTTGKVICWSSAGACGFKGKRKSSEFAAKKAAETAARNAKNFSVKQAQVFVKGPGSGRESAIRAIFAAGIKVSLIREKTSIPHNGCRPPKRRRV
uniref:Small ribosomal subunit protein uS11c n=1 Tax=Polytoma uvella TaxID=40532 RepID=A0A1L2M5D0_9CHLO|nr:ribosomal protein S11 [Polytoma uvella]